MGTLDRYETVAGLGRGTSSTVVRALDRESGRDVAIKQLEPRLAHDPERQVQLIREAGILARVRHPGIVDVLDVLPSGNATFLVLEFVPGETLADRLDRVHTLAPAEAAGLVAQAARALDAAHAVGVVHGDINPSNLFVTPAGRLKVGDFGIAATFGGEPAGPGRPAPAYRAPERCTGAASTASDVFALGAVLFRCVAGRPPAPGEDLGAVARGLPDDFVSLCTATLDADPARRPGSAGAVAAALEALAPSLPGTAAPAGPRSEPGMERTAPGSTASTGWRRSLAGVAATVVLVAGLTAALHALRPARHATAKPVAVAAVRAPAVPAAAVPIAPPVAVRPDPVATAPPAPDPAVRAAVRPVQARPAPRPVRALAPAGQFLAAAAPAVAMSPATPDPNQGQGVIEVRHELGAGTLEVRVDEARVGLVPLADGPPGAAAVLGFHVPPGTHRVRVRILEPAQGVDAEMAWDERWGAGAVVTRRLALGGAAPDWHLVLLSR